MRDHNQREGVGRYSKIIGGILTLKILGLVILALAMNGRFSWAKHLALPNLNQ